MVAWTEQSSAIRAAETDTWIVEKASEPINPREARGPTQPPVGDLTASQVPLTWFRLRTKSSSPISHVIGTAIC